MIIPYLIFLLISFYISIKNPTYFVILFIIVTTKFFGFFNAGDIMISGSEVGYFLFNFITIFSSFIILFRIKILKNNVIILMTISFIYLYGIVLPVIFQYSTIMQAILASKGLMFYSLLFYLIANSKKIDMYKIFQFIKYLGLYLTTIEIIYAIIYISPLQYLELNNQHKIIQRVYYATYINFSLFLYLIDWLNNKISFTKMLTINLYLLCGLFLTDYMSIFFSAIFMFLTIIIIYNKKMSFNFTSILIKGSILLSILFLFFSFNETYLQTVNKIVMDNLNGKSIELSSRDYYNKFRWDAISDEPLMGFGFIHKNADILNHYNNNINNKFMETFLVIDSGYVDLLVRFGYGGVFLLLIFIFILFYTSMKYHYSQYTIIFILIIIQYFAINYTWSVFTYPQGIIPLSIMIFVLQNKLTINRRLN